ncbi:hypothetical protein BBP40_009211 [Aspergillus hancockii]|nr:hypothetical protein BBP40_009211 [Aspergillus hancockii]
MDMNRGSELSEPDVATRKVQAQARLNDQSRGLLEIRALPGRGQLPTNLIDIDSATFIHRSILDFLQTHHKIELMEACEEFDVSGAISQIVLAEIKFFGLCSFHSPRLRGLLLKDLPHLLRSRREDVKDVTIFCFLMSSILPSSALNGSALFRTSKASSQFTSDSRLVYDNSQFTHVPACFLGSTYDTGNIDCLKLVAPYLDGFAQEPHMEITYVKGWSQINILNTALLAALRWLSCLSSADKMLYATLLASLLASCTDNPWELSYPEHQGTVQVLTMKNSAQSLSLRDLIVLWELANVQGSRSSSVLGLIYRTEDIYHAPGYHPRTRIWLGMALGW